jgi:multidrug resistance efflux pump
MCLLLSIVNFPKSPLSHTRTLSPISAFVLSVQLDGARASVASLEHRLRDSEGASVDQRTMLEKQVAAAHAKAQDLSRQNELLLSQMETLTSQSRRFADVYFGSSSQSSNSHGSNSSNGEGGSSSSDASGEQGDAMQTGVF